MNVTIGSLFSGIGGLELGLERAIPGSRVVWQVEIDPFCRRVLERHWPHAARHEDVRAVGAADLARVDVICGGFPCQDLSVAGRGAGLDGARSGLFFEYMRVIRELRPRVVVMENVTALLARGLGRVLGELASCGYDAEWDCVPASSVGAPHQRDRIFIVAHTVGDDVRDEQGRRERAGWGTGASVSRDARSHRSTADTDVQHLDVPAGHEGERLSVAAWPGCGRQAPDANGLGPQALIDGATPRSERAGRTLADGEHPRLAGGAVASWRDGDAFSWRNAPSPVRRMDDGVPARVDGPRRRRPVNDKHRLKALGNAVVPQVAQLIGARVAALVAA